MVLRSHVFLLTFYSYTLCAYHLWLRCCYRKCVWTNHSLSTAYCSEYRQEYFGHNIFLNIYGLTSHSAQHVYVYLDSFLLFPLSPVYTALTGIFSMPWLIRNSTLGFFSMPCLLRKFTLGLLSMPSLLTRSTLGFSFYAMSTKKAHIVIPFYAMSTKKVTWPNICAVSQKCSFMYIIFYFIPS